MADQIAHLIYKEQINDLQQNLALKDREIMRLREALNKIIGHDMACSVIAKQALSTSLTYDDLMAWHNEQFGEPVAYVDKQSLINFENGLSTKEWMWAKSDSFLIPVYAKKG